MSLTLNNLSLEIYGRTVCQNINKKIKPGDIHSIIGRNGSGKTHLLHCLAGLLTPTCGDIIFEKKRLTKPNRSIGLLEQEHQIDFPMSVVETMQLGAYPERKTNAHLSELLTLVELPAKQLAHTLSGGEKRRLAIATLLAQNPSVYLLDEPFNHLDYYFKEKMLTHFKKIAKENHAAIIMVLHDLELAKRISVDVWQL